MILVNVDAKKWRKTIKTKQTWTINTHQHSNKTFNNNHCTSPNTFVSFIISISVIGIISTILRVYQMFVLFTFQAPALYWQSDALFHLFLSICSPVSCFANLCSWWRISTLKMNWRPKWESLLGHGTWVGHL